MSAAARPAGPHPSGVATAAVAALAFNAFTWGLSWWPFRRLEALGLHPLWATAGVYLLSVALITLARPRAWRELVGTPALWGLIAASGTTNAAFNWAVTIGDVVRVVLLFYLMPLWAVLLARLLLGERPTRWDALRVALALTGAAIVLRPDAGGWPLPRSLAEWLGVLGGFSFALNNVLLRREAARSDGARALAMFCGGVLVAGVLAALLTRQGVITPPPAPALGWVTGALGLALWFLLGNLALQYGAARLAASATAVVMVSEVLFASVSAVALGAGALTPSLAIGGALIVAAALLAVRRR
jgi:drug/metabolite transporter (DMT)-like permease